MGINNMLVEFYRIEQVYLKKTIESSKSKEVLTNRKQKHLSIRIVNIRLYFTFTFHSLFIFHFIFIIPSC